MTMAAVPPSTGPREAGVLLRDAWTLFADHASFILSLHAVLIPLTLLPRLAAVPGAASLRGGALLALQLLLWPLVTGALLDSLPALEQGESRPLRAAFRAGARHWMRLFPATLAVMALVMAPIAGAFLGVRALGLTGAGPADPAALPPALVLEAMVLTMAALIVAALFALNYALVPGAVVIGRAAHPLRLSRRLIAGHRWRLVTLMGVFFLYTMFQSLSSGILESSELRLALLPFAFLDLVVMALMTIVLYLLYIDLAAAAGLVSDHPAESPDPNAPGA